MPRAVVELAGRNEVSDSKAGSIRVGWVVDITEQGHAIVDYPGNLLGPIPARSAITAAAPQNLGDVHRNRVLLVFEDGDPSLPIVLGIVNDQLFPKVEEEHIVVPEQPPRHAVLDGKAMMLSAEKEIVLRCGKSSVTLQADGKIVLRGTKLLSRASRTNKIRGASVSIN